MRNGVQKSLSILLLCIVFFYNHATAEDAHKHQHIQWTSSAGIPVMISATILSPSCTTLPTYAIRVQQWDSASVYRFSQFGLRIDWNNAGEFVLPHGKALLFSESTYESMVFSNDPNISWRYMTGRAETCYLNALQGQYVQYTLSYRTMKNFGIFDGEFEPLIKTVTEYLEVLDIKLGPPLQCTIYYPYSEGTVDYSDCEPDFIEIAFERHICDTRLSPWSQGTRFHDLTPISYITLYIDSVGVSNLVVPLVFDTIVTVEDRELLSIDQAIMALEEHLCTTLFPNGGENILIDHIALEYVPIPQNDQYVEYFLIPVWSFYTNYENDILRQVVSLNAYTGATID